MEHYLPIITAALPIIGALILLEGLLSVDNALVLAAIAKGVPNGKGPKALRYGIIIAILLRVVCLLFAGIIIANPWIRLLGAGYLIYLMCSHLGVAEEDEQNAHQAKSTFLATMVYIGFTDLAFSVDNVIAAVAMSNQLWVVITGVVIGIIAMQFVAQAFMKLLDVFPILAKVAYVLVGYIGVQLMVEYFFHIDFTSFEKFGTIIGIVVAGVIYDKVTFLQTILGPVFTWLGEVMGNLAELADSLAKPVVGLCKAVFGIFHKSKAQS